VLKCADSLQADQYSLLDAPRGAIGRALSLARVIAERCFGLGVYAADLARRLAALGFGWPGARAARRWHAMFR
jgi:hypothetical protein